MLTPEHVLMTTDTVGGVWSYSLELAFGLAAAGLQISLATMGTRLSPAQRAQVRNCPRVEVHESEFRLEWMEDPWEDVDAAGDWLLQLEDALHPDIVHLNGYAHGALPFRAPVVVVAHSDVLSWFQQVRQREAPESWAEYRRRVRAGLEGADRTIAVSRALARWVATNYEVACPQVIWNGRSARACGAGGKECFVLACGRAWDEAKNLLALDAAAASVHWPVMIAGSAASPDGGNVVFRNAKALGVVPEAEMHSWYSLASIYALPARYEPFGLSVLEAGLSGCALVLGDIPTLRELWEGAAIFVPPYDPDALAHCINDLANRPGILSRMARRAMARALWYPSDKMTAQYLSTYHTISNARATREVTTACEL